MQSSLIYICSTILIPFYLMSTARSWWPYGLAVILFGALKMSYTHATTSDLLWLLKPTNALVSAALGSVSELRVGEGFVHDELNIAIDKSCSGFNFWLLCSTMLLVAGMQAGGQNGRRWWLLSLPLVAYGLTVLVNASRIITAVSLHRALPELGQRYTWLHQAEGALMYLFFLVLIYAGFQLLCYYLFRPNEDPA